MGKVVATYLVKITLREPDDLEEGDPVTVPTNDELVAFIEEAADSDLVGVLNVKATSERTDR